MEFTISNESLNKGVQTVSRAVSSRNTINALTGIYMEAKEDCILFRGTNLEIGIECMVEAEVTKNGVAIIPAKQFTDLVRKLPYTDIKFIKEKDNNNLIIKYLNSELSFNTYDPEQYSFLPDMKGHNKVKIDPIVFSEMIKQVSIAISNDESRPIFTGVYCEKADENLFRMVATDTHRLALRDSTLETINEFVPVIIPGKALLEVNRIIEKEDDDLILEIGENQAEFITGSIKVKVRLIDGQFPSYQDVIPNEYSTFIKIQSKEFMNSLERAVLMSYDETRTSTNVIKLQIEGNTLIISSRSPDLGYVREEINCFKEGENLEIAFNGKYLLDALKVIGDENLKIKMNGPLSPAIFQGDNKKDYLCLILPLRI